MQEKEGSGAGSWLIDTFARSKRKRSRHETKQPLGLNPRAGRTTQLVEKRLPPIELSFQLESESSSGLHFCANRIARSLAPICRRSKPERIQLLHPLHRSPAFHGRLLHSSSIALSQQSSSRSSAMPALKRPAAGHATTTQGSASCSKRSRTSIASTDEYEEISGIGEGGFGFVLKARHLATGKTVAIKYLSPPDDFEESTDVAELLHEARFLEACSGNPYVVGFESLVRHPATGELGLVMEYVAAPSLYTFMSGRRCGPPLTESTVRAFMWKLLTGAKMMHDRHVVHRDLKPKNILVGQGGELIKICDLGLAISMSELPPYAEAGTMNYMAPEMLLQKPDYDALVDTWSLGCVMAEMLTGKTLFLGKDDDEDEDESNDEIVQLCSIFRVLGTPDEKTWPGFTSLPLTAKAMQLLPARHKHNRLRDIFPREKLSEQGFEVLQGLLTCNPDKRLTAAKALKLPWFTVPRPAAAAKVDASVELPTKKALRIKFIGPKIPEKNILKIPLAMWNAQRV